MEDDPSTATRQKEGLFHGRGASACFTDGEGDAVISAGSTGALLTGATLTVQAAYRGIRRAAALAR